MNPSVGIKPIMYRGFKGLYKRGSEETCPPDHLTECYNCIFPGDGQVSIRENVSISSSNLLAGFVQSYSVANVAGGAVLLTLSSGSGNFWDETHAVQLASFPGADDFVCLSIFGRAYIAMKQQGSAWGVAGTCNTTTASAGYSSNIVLTSGNILSYMNGGGIILNGVACSIIAWANSTHFIVDHDFGISAGVNYSCSNVFVYNGNGINVSPAGGRKPVANFSLGNWGAGDSDAGWHAMNFCYQYANGQLSPPSNTSLAFNFNGTGVNILFADTPPANAVARVILSTQSFINTAGITTWPNPPAEMFFVPNGTIPVATVNVNLNVFDVELIASGDYTFDLSPYIPGASALRFYHGRLVAIGQYSFPDNIFVSDQDIPEQVNGVSGVINMPVDYGLNTSNTGAVIRDVLYIMKPNSTYSVQDNGGNPDTWAVSAVDSGIGAWDNGLSVFASSFSGQDIMDTCLV